MADRTDQAVDHFTAGLPESQKRLGWFGTPRISRVLESYCRGYTEMHVHPWVRLVEDDRIGFCSVFEYSGFEDDVVG